MNVSPPNTRRFAPARTSGRRDGALSARLGANVRLWLALIALPMLLGAGCNYLGPAVAIISGPPTKSAAFELDASKTYVIFIDDLRSRLPKRSLRDIVSQAAEERILAEGLLKPDNLISATATRRVAASETNVNKLTIVEIGQRVGADVVIYITVDGFLLTRDGVSAMPTVLSRMKILDVHENRRIWPGAEEGHSIIVQPQRQQGDLSTDLAGRNAMEVALAKRFGVAIAQVFYKHEIRESATGN